MSSLAFESSPGARDTTVCPLLSFTVPSRKTFSSISPQCCCSFTAARASAFPCSERMVTSPTTALLFSADNSQEHRSSPLGNCMCFGLHRLGHHGRWSQPARLVITLHSAQFLTPSRSTRCLQLHSALHRHLPLHWAGLH